MEYKAVVFNRTLFFVHVVELLGLSSKAKDCVVKQTHLGANWYFCYASSYQRKRCTRRL